MSAMTEFNPDNDSRVAFEARTDNDLKWIKSTLEKLLATCVICGHRVNQFEAHIEQSPEWKNRMISSEERIRSLELGMTQVRAVGGILGTLGGLLSGIALKLWGDHS